MFPSNGQRASVARKENLEITIMIIIIMKKFIYNQKKSKNCANKGKDREMQWSFEITRTLLWTKPRPQITDPDQFCQ